MVASKVQIARIEHRCDTGQTLQNRRFEIVDHEFGRDAQFSEGVFVTGEKVLHGLRDSELRKHAAAIGQHHDEERQPATSIAHRNASEGSPVDLRTFPCRKVQLQINRPLGRPNATDVIPKDRHAPAVPLLAQTLEDLHSAIRVGVQQSRDARFEGIKQTTARHPTARLEV
jgi:hypothetical protein